MPLGLSLGVSQQLSHKLSPRLTKKAKQLIQLLKTLRAPSFPSAITGVPGIEMAHEMLLQQNAKGVIIGGIAEAILHGDGKSLLAKHKDVDVLVVSDSFVLSQPFEGGVDWWLPQNRRVRFFTEASSGEAAVRYWSNGYGCCLCFGAVLNPNLPAGLYLPSASFVHSLRMHEAINGVKHATPVDSDTEDRLAGVLMQRLSNGPCVTSQRLFKERCFLWCRGVNRHSDYVHANTIGFLPIPLEVAMAVRGGNFID